MTERGCRGPRHLMVLTRLWRARDVLSRLRKARVQQNGDGGTGDRTGPGVAIQSRGGGRPVVQHEQLSGQQLRITGTGALGQLGECPQQPATVVVGGLLNASARFGFCGRIGECAAAVARVGELRGL